MQKNIIYLMKAFNNDQVYIFYNNSITLRILLSLFISCLLTTFVYFYLFTNNTIYFICYICFYVLFLFISSFMNLFYKHFVIAYYNRLSIYWVFKLIFLLVISSMTMHNILKFKSKYSLHSNNILISKDNNKIITNCSLYSQVILSFLQKIIGNDIKFENNQSLNITYSSNSINNVKLNHQNFTLSTEYQLSQELNAFNSTDLILPICNNEIELVIFPVYIFAIVGLIKNIIIKTEFSEFKIFFNLFLLLPMFQVVPSYLHIYCFMLYLTFLILLYSLLIFRKKYNFIEILIVRAILLISIVIVISTSVYMFTRKTNTLSINISNRSNPLSNKLKFRKDINHNHYQSHLYTYNPINGMVKDAFNKTDVLCNSTNLATPSINSNKVNKEVSSITVKENQVNIFNDNSVLNDNSFYYINDRHSENILISIMMIIIIILVFYLIGTMIIGIFTMPLIKEYVSTKKLYYKNEEYKVVNKNFINYGSNKGSLKPNYQQEDNQEDDDCFQGKNKTELNCNDKTKKEVSNTNTNNPTLANLNIVKHENLINNHILVNDEIDNHNQKDDSEEEDGYFEGKRKAELNSEQKINKENMKSIEKNPNLFNLNQVNTDRLKSIQIVSTKPTSISKDDVKLNTEEKNQNVKETDENILSNNIIKSTFLKKIKAEHKVNTKITYKTEDNTSQLNKSRNSSNSSKSIMTSKTGTNLENDIKLKKEIIKEKEESVSVLGFNPYFKPESIIEEKINIRKHKSNKKLTEYSNIDH